MEHPTEKENQSCVFYVATPHISVNSCMNTLWFPHIYKKLSIGWLHVYLVDNSARPLNNWGLQLVTGTPHPHRRGQFLAVY